MQAQGATSPRGSRVRNAFFAMTLLAIVPMAFAQAPPAAAGGTLDRIRETGRIRLGYRADARPLSYRDESGNAAGYSVALCQAVVEATKAELGAGALAVEWVPVTAESRFGALQAGEIDLLCGAETVTLARRAEVSFSIPTFPGGVGALVRADATARFKEVLAGREQAFRPTWRANAGQVLQTKKFTVVAGTTAEKWLADKRKELDLVSEVATTNSYEAGLGLVLDREADAFFGDRVLLLGVATRSPSAKELIVLDRLFTVEPLALALARGDEAFRLVVDRTLSRLYASGAIGELYAKWCGEPDESTLAFFRMSAIPD